MMITLADGRALDVEVSGPEDGTPLVFHHGTPGCVTQYGSMRRESAARGLRLITYSRAGYGNSTRNPGRSIVDVVADIEAVADELDVGRFYVAGWSGGGPHALATGARLSDRVLGVVAIASVAPYPADGIDWLAGMGEQNIEEFGLALEGEAAIRPYHEKEAEGLREVDAAGVITELATLLPDVDRAVLTDEFGADLAAQLRGGVVPVDGWVDDDLAFTKPWGFDLAELRGVRTSVWQGSADLMVPFAHGEWLASRLPNATVHLEQGEGHLSIGLTAIGRMLDEIIA